MDFRTAAAPQQCFDCGRSEENIFRLGSFDLSCDNHGSGWFTRAAGAKIFIRKTQCFGSGWGWWTNLIHARGWGSRSPKSISRNKSKLSLIRLRKSGGDMTVRSVKCQWQLTKVGSNAFHLPTLPGGASMVSNLHVVDKLTQCALFDWNAEITPLYPREHSKVVVANHAWWAVLGRRRRERRGTCIWFVRWQRSAPGTRNFQNQKTKLILLRLN